MVSAYLLLTNVPPTNWCAPIVEGNHVIGRLPECDIVIPDSYLHVSRQHALIVCRGEAISIQDLGSSGGTFLNGVPVLAGHETRAIIGDRLSLAGLEFYFVSPDASILQQKLSSEPREALESGSTFIGMKASRSQIPGLDERLSTLSPAELEVVRWMCRGMTSVDDLGRRLFRSPHTVRTQLGSIYRKLGTHSRDELVSLLRQAEIAWTRSSDEDLESLRRTDH